MRRVGLQPLLSLQGQMLVVQLRWLLFLSSRCIGNTCAARKHDTLPWSKIALRAAAATPTEPTRAIASTAVQLAAAYRAPPPPHVEAIQQNIYETPYPSKWRGPKACSESLEALTATNNVQTHCGSWRACGGMELATKLLLRHGLAVRV